MATTTTRLEAARAAEWAAWRENAGHLAGTAADDRTWAAAMAAHRLVLEEEEALRAECGCGTR